MKLLSLIALCSSALMAGEINWTPRFTTIAVEGGALQRATFTDGERTYALSVDGETRIDANGRGARITFARVPTAVFDIHSPTGKSFPLPAAGEGYSELITAAHALVIEGHDEITDLSNAADVLNINGWKSHRFTFRYGLHGRRYFHAITFLTMESGQQVVLSVISSETEFENSMAHADHLIRTWHEVAKGAPTGS